MCIFVFIHFIATQQMVFSTKILRHLAIPFSVGYEAKNAKNAILFKSLDMGWVLPHPVGMSSYPSRRRVCLLVIG